MKIFQVVPYYPPHIGGMEFYVDYLSKRLATKGNGVKVFTSSDKNYSYREKVDGVEIIKLKVSAKFYNVPIVSSLLAALSDEEKPDIIDAHQYPVFFSDISALFSVWHKIPMFLHVHVIPGPKSVFSGCIADFYYKTLEKLTLRGSTYVIAPSLAYKAILTRMGVDEARIFVVPYGVDLRRFDPAETGETFRRRFNCGDARVILTVGRLNYQKGFHYLLRAMPIVLRDVPDAKLVIVGDGELLTPLQHLSHSLGLDDNVVFPGPLPSSGISEAYAAADVFVLPSLFESLGISLLEAQAMGKPVVATRVGGAPEALAEGKSGILVEPKKPDELAEAIVTLLHDQTLAKSMGQYARKFIEKNFDLEKSVDRVLEHYENVIGT